MRYIQAQSSRSRPFEVKTMNSVYQVTITNDRRSPGIRRRYLTKRSTKDAIAICQTSIPKIFKTREAAEGWVPLVVDYLWEAVGLENAETKVEQNQVRSWSGMIYTVEVEEI